MDLSPQHILVIRLSSIGDIVHASAIARHLRAKFPQGKIHWVVRRDNQLLLAHNPYIDVIHAYDARAHRGLIAGLREWITFCRSLQSVRWTHIYDAHNNPRSWILCCLVRAPQFIRRSKHRLKRFLLFGLKLNLFNADLSAAQSFITPLKKWGVSNDGQGTDLYLPDDIYQQVSNKLKSAGADHSAAPVWVAVAPKTAWRKKTWPLARWEVLIQRILENSSFGVILLAGPQDHDCKNLMFHNFSRRFINLQGQLNLLESAALLKKCKVLVSGDTGLLHMAEAQKIPVIGLYGPTPFGFPLNSHSRKLEHPLWCRPCSKDGSGPCLNFEFQKCMKLITPEEVYGTLSSMISSLDGPR